MSVRVDFKWWDHYISGVIIIWFLITTSGAKFASARRGCDTGAMTDAQIIICFEGLIIGFFICLNLSHMMIIGEEGERGDYIEKSDLENTGGCSRNTKIKIHYGWSKYIYHSKRHIYQHGNMSDLWCDRDEAQSCSHSQRRLCCSSCCHCFLPYMIVGT